MRLSQRISVNLFSPPSASKGQFKIQDGAIILKFLTEQVQEFPCQSGDLEKQTET